MRPIVDMDTVQIEITNVCPCSCSNCTRFCGHHKHGFFMTEEQFDQALASMKNFPQMVGIMGGEPLIHPLFESFCKKAKEAFPKEQLGLWTSFPKGFERYREIIVETFGNIFLNDHHLPVIYHHPLLVAADEVMSNEAEMYYLIDRCWIQNSWSASITPRGAFFCEVAAAWAELLNDGYGWPVEPGWWWRTPKDFTSQIERYCHRCGGAMPLKRRLSTEGIDDISVNNLRLLESVGSRKVKAGKYKVHDCTTVRWKDQEPMAAYKDEHFRNEIAARYGMFLVLNSKGFQVPYLTTKDSPQPRERLLDIWKEEYKRATA
jgi:hypothetical protein